MKKSAKVAGWEIMQNLRNKQFIIGIFLTPVLILVFGGLPNLLARLGEEDARKFYYATELSVVQETLTEIQQEQFADLDLVYYTGPPAELAAEAEAAEADGYFIIDDQFIREGHIYLQSFSTPVDNYPQLQTLMTEVLQQYRLQEHQLEAEVLKSVTASASIIPRTPEDDGQDIGFRIISALIFGGGFFFLILTSGTMLMQSALKEKKEKMTEIILSSIPPKTLMAGKITGHLVLGIIQIGTWFAIGLPLANYFFDFPVLEAFFNPALPLFILFGLLGYLLFAAIYIGVGATMEDLQSATNAQSLVFMLPVLPVIIAGPVLNNPTGLLAQIASFFPLTSPIIVIARTAMGAIATWEIAVSAAILLVTCVLLTWLAAKIFRVGMLMYGKSASPAEVLRWLKY